MGPGTRGDGGALSQLQIEWEVAQLPREEQGAMQDLGLSELSHPTGRPSSLHPTRSHLLLYRRKTSAGMDH